MDPELQPQFALDPNALPPMMEQRAEPPPTLDMGTQLPPAPLPAPAPARVTPVQAPVQTPAQQTVEPQAMVPGAAAQGQVAQQADVQAMQPLVPPAMVPGAPAQTQLTETDDEVGSHKRQIEDDEKNYRSTPRSHLGRHDTIEPPNLPQIQTDPDFAALQRIKQLAGTLGPKERKEADAIYNRGLARLHKKVDAEQKRLREEFKAKQTDDLKKIDEHHETLQTRDETASKMDTYISQQRTKLEQDGANTDPKVGRKHLFDLKVGPQGTLEPHRIREAMMAITALNPWMTTDQAYRAVSVLASPGPTNPKEDKEPFNGIWGKGGANYKVLSPDLRGNYLVQLQDGTVLRLKPSAYAIVQYGREEGWKRARTFEADLAAQREKAARKDDSWLEQKAREVNKYLPIKR